PPGVRWGQRDGSVVRRSEVAGCTCLLRFHCLFPFCRFDCSYVFSGVRAVGLRLSYMACLLSSDLINRTQDRAPAFENLLGKLGDRWEFSRLHGLVQQVAAG